MSNRRLMLPIVGIGASAGGIEALEGFFKNVPSKPGIGFIVVTHLSPDRESLLPEILERYTDLGVIAAEHDALVRPNCVYVLPADAIVTIKAGRLQLRRPSEGPRERKPIDILFSSLAMDREEYAACVVLSGGDGDGTLGVKAVKERGGLTMAQVSDGYGPRHPSMPNSAISTGYVDFALPVDQMGPKLAQFAQMVAEDGGKPSAAIGGEGVQTEISAIIRSQLGHDFAGYKPKTFFRRVQRRMHVVQTDDWSAYIEHLKADADEVEALFRDLLINVTNFFRDADAFNALRKIVIPKLFEGRDANDVVRIWTPGCATGEETYSVAILLREHMETLKVVPRVQIFATDIDETALGVARAGRYPEALLHSVSAERIERFFTSEGASFTVKKAVRDLCIFSPHNILRDPPFSQLDLVSCRNLLIYFGAKMQEEALPTFHHSLREGGYLFLGLSETIGKFANLFEVIDKKHRIFRAKLDVTGSPRLPLAVRQRRELTAPDRARLSPTTVTTGVTLRRSLEAQVLERYAPAHLLVNREGDIIHFSVRTNRYLELAPGAPTRKLMALARKSLRLDLRAAFSEAVEAGARVCRDSVPVMSNDGHLQMVRITVEPLLERRDGAPLYVVVFADQGPPLSPEAARDRLPDAESRASVLVERELHETKERLQSLIEEYETSVEELRSSNEELVSVNEEMQSSNEELEASKEELQSLNEELNTVNAELNAKIDALDSAKSDLEHLFESTQIPTVFLDRHLVIRSYTPSVKDLFNILPSDVGRPLTDLNSRLPLPGFLDDIGAVFASGEPLERDVFHPDAGKHFNLRIAPYRVVDRRAEGVVVTFTDVTRLANAQSHQQVLIAELNHRVKNMLMIVIGIAQQTHKSAATPQAFLAAFIGRLRAMARSYELLSRENWTESPLEELVRTELSPFGVERFTLAGPPIRLKPKQALSMGMILHELATNAGKYGALSGSTGIVSVEWCTTGPELCLQWEESGGPARPSAERRGFGLTLIERETSYNLGGEAVVKFEPSGVHAHIKFSLGEA